MMAPDEQENATFAQLRTDVVTKDDGRYLIYYSWPEEEDEDDAPESARPQHPAPEPWSPEGGPADV
jgi:hypothetical protein